MPPRSDSPGPVSSPASIDCDARPLLVPADADADLPWHRDGLGDRERLHTLLTCLGGTSRQRHAVGLHLARLALTQGLARVPGIDVADVALTIGTVALELELTRIDGSPREDRPALDAALVFADARRGVARSFASAIVGPFGEDSAELIDAALDALVAQLTALGLVLEGVGAGELLFEVSIAALLIDGDVLAQIGRRYS